MIFDKLENWKNYFNSENIAKLQPAFELLNTLNADSVEQRYEIDGDNMFCMVASYQTKPNNEAQIEYHREYIDIQLLISGEEFLDWATPALTPVTLPYDSDNDVALHATNLNDNSRLRLRPGFFAILFPNEGHAPGIAVDNITQVKKAVVKIHRSLLT
jgi:biofilm protein TabA